MKLKKAKASSPERLQCAADLRVLNQAIERNGSKPLIPWAKARKQFGIN